VGAGEYDFLNLQEEIVQQSVVQTINNKIIKNIKGGEYV
jgi:hypothetical protein